MTTDYLSERIDLRKLWTQFMHRIWIVIAATIVGAIIGVLAYTIYSNIKCGNAVYQISNDYYISFDYDNYPEGPDYFNAYTWDGFLRDDPIVNYALEELPDVSKEQILNAVSAEIKGDYRVITVNVRGTDASLVQKISDAYKGALANFADNMDMLKSVDVWTDADIVEFDEYTREGNAAFLGGFIGFLIILFAVLINVVLDNRIYTERDWIYRYADIPYLGSIDSEEYKVNRDYIIGSDAEATILHISDFQFDAELMTNLRASEAVILSLQAGMTDGDLIDKVVYTLKKQGINISGVTF